MRSRSGVLAISAALIGSLLLAGTASASEGAEPLDTEIWHAPDEGSVVDASPLLIGYRGTASGDEIAGFECRIDDAPEFSECAAPDKTDFYGGGWVSPSGDGGLALRLANGEHSIEVRAVDSAGNVDPTPATRAFSVNDDTAPDTQAFGRPWGGTYAEEFTTRKRWVRFKMSTVGVPFADSRPDDGHWYECRLDDAPWQWCNRSQDQSIKNLTPGDYTFYARAVDGADNRDETPAAVDFTILEPPRSRATRCAEAQSRRDQAQAIFAMQKAAADQQRQRLRAVKRNVRRARRSENQRWIKRATRQKRKVSRRYLEAKHNKKRAFANKSSTALDVQRICSGDQ